MFNKIILIVLLLSFAMFASSCTQVNDPSDIKVRNELDIVMKEAMATYEAPGMILAVWVPGKGEYIKAIGLSDIKAKRMMKVSDRFRIGSNTKSVVATVLLQLVDEKKLKLDDKLSKFFPEWPNSDAINIRMLLNHTSGIFNYSTSPAFGKLLMADPKRPFTHQQLLNYAIKEKPYFEPGKGFKYSNTNTVLVGRIIEKITGHELADEINTRLIDPLRLKQTYFPKASETNGSLSRGYIFENGRSKDWTYANPSWGWAAGAMISDIYDLNKLITAVTNGTLLSKSLQKERMASWTPYSADLITGFPTLRYGYNLFIMGGFVGHNGGLPGYVSYMMRDPNTGVTTVMMMNSQPQGDATLEVLKKVIQIILPGRKV